jgi:GNAT superfamily N-acetyltransferase
VSNEHLQLRDLRDLRPEQRADVRSLILAGLGEHWGAVDENLNRDLDDMLSTYAAGRTLVVCDGDRVVATGTLMPNRVATAELVRMSVALTHRRCGVGRQIVNELIATARRWRRTRVILETSTDWNDVVHFYVSCGFNITHHEDGSFGRNTWFALDLDGDAETNDVG